jgi:hypothetical protein
MEIQKIVYEILDLVGKLYTDKLSPRSGILIGELVENLIIFTSMKEAALVFDKSDSALEHLIIRNFKPIFSGKLSTESWDNYLLSLVNLRKCSCCNEIKPPNFFYKNIDNKSSRCKICCDSTSNINRPKYIKGNRVRSRKHYLEHKHEYILKASKRRRLLYQAMPSWANLDKLKQIYSECPVGMHVDHIVPLQGKLVCGLHVENNLQYLTAEDNLKKSNKFKVD